jgi:hypothetical protein
VRVTPVEPARPLALDQIAGLFRALLGRYLDVDPGTLRFSAGAHGKPGLRDRTGTPTAATATAGAIDLSGVLQPVALVHPESVLLRAQRGR